MIDKISINTHSSIKLTLDKIIYFDPYKIENKISDADIIFLTHDHYDHFDVQSINNIINDSTIIVMPKSMEKEKIHFKNNKVITVVPNNVYEIENIKINTIPSYNLNKDFHLKKNNWCGYIVNINNISYYVAGDTDLTLDNSKVKCDIALVPIGGIYTMDYKEAAKLINIIKPKIAIPTHYGSIVGNIKDADKFKSLIDESIDCKILIK